MLFENNQANNNLNNIHASRPRATEPTITTNPTTVKQFRLFNHKINGIVFYICI